MTTDADAALMKKTQGRYRSTQGNLRGLQREENVSVGNIPAEGNGGSRRRNVSQKGEQPWC